MTHQLIFIVFPDFQLLDLSGPIGAFEMANRLMPNSYEWTVVSPQGGTIRSSSGLSLSTSSFALTAEKHIIDSMIAVGGEGVIDASQNAAMINFIVEQSKAVRRITSICSGTYLLAAAGLLQGRHATTHWKRSLDFRQRYPEVILDEDRIYVNDDNIWTSAGISAGIDLALALITDDLGEAIARKVAHQLVVYYRRPGGQSQYSELLELGTGHGRFTALLDYIRNNLDKPLMINDLADQMCMSPRHFARCFNAEVGTTPAKAVERMRVEAATLALEKDHSSVQTVARQCGFIDIERMRRAFIRLKGIPPSMVKRKF